MPDQTLSYLVSTAGHAQDQNDRHPHDIKSILQLINEGAEEFGDEKVVGFTSLRTHASASSSSWICDRFSFRELLSLSGRLAAGLSSQHGLGTAKSGQLVSLLCPTGLNFLLAWIALMRMGYGVVFIAPQCSPSAIQHLVQSTSSVRLLFHPKYEDLAQSAQALAKDTIVTELPTYETYKDFSTLNSRSPLSCEVKDVESTSHVFHTSGTSGTPKPIPQVHLLSVSVLPRRALPTYLSTEKTDLAPFELAAYTTTPLFHGGVSDLLRAWMARSMIYFYPTSDTPITASNVVGSVAACNSPPDPLTGRKLQPAREEERAKRFKVGSFLSVPYILTILSEDLDGPSMTMLKGLDFVSTGGAPLDTAIGDTMVDKGVHLVSRLGSSECGFLMSSHRDYATERDWEWLRNDSAYSDALVFEPVNTDKDGATSAEKYEMIVTDKWTSKTKTNRDDGSYATGDLYIPHPKKANVWRYVGRGDDVIVMSNGEKASPGPIETVMRSSNLLSDALVVGSDQPQLGLLLFPKSAPAVDLVDRLDDLISKANASSPSFAQVSKEMCLVVTDMNKAKLLPKSSKGTIQRGLAYEVFREEIETIYKGGNTSSGTAEHIEKRNVGEIEDVLLNLIKEIMGDKRKPIRDLNRQNDLFAWGVDSLIATRIRSAIIRSLNVGNQSLPKNIVFERPSVESLAQYIFDRQEGRQFNEDDIEASYRLMKSLVGKYANFGTPKAQEGNHMAGGPKTVVLTGVTGSLGAYLIERLDRLPPSVIGEIVCLVRADDDAAALLRVEQGLSQRSIELLRKDRIVAYTADLADPKLGLTEERYTDLQSQVDVVIHAAWPVHFASSLVSFEDNIRGTRHMLDLVTGAANHNSRLYFCSSLASVLARPPPSNVIYETPTDDPATASPIGYSQSKWATEKLCRLANESALKGRVSILRVGQLCGDTKTGYWSEKEGWPLMIKTAQITGCLPLLDEKPSWLQVDLAAQAIVDVVITDGDTEFAHIYHIAHPDTVRWDTVLNGLKSAGVDFEAVSPAEWLHRVEGSSDDPVQNPSKQMLSMWQSAYGKEGPPQSDVLVDTRNAQKASKTMSQLGPITEGDMTHMVSAWKATGFLN